MTATVTATVTGAPAISDYAVIGDCRTAALISRAGSIDWLCWPRFDSPSLFAAVLDPERGGRFAVAPAGPFQARRRYLDGTNVLETTFDAGGATLVLTDFMPVAADDGDGAAGLLPGHELTRIVEARDGDVEVDVLFDPRPDWGASPPRVRPSRWGDVQVAANGGVLNLRSDAQPAPALGTTRLRLRAGQRVTLSLTYSEEAPAVLPTFGARPAAVLEQTVRCWRAWSACARYHGPQQALVLRSALALKLLCYAPSGAVVAAPTTSLPERVGGDSNWDYRYCWLRDASLTVRALLALGHAQEATAFVDWLLHATRLTRPRLRVLYDVYGVPPRPERLLAHLTGYRGSRPVRAGNAAAAQEQLDVYGEVVESVLALAAASAGRGLLLDGETRGMLLSFARFVARHWEQPDSGIWEVRGATRRYTPGLALGAVALERLAPLARRPAEEAQLCDTAARMRHAIETRAWSDAAGSYLDALDGGTVDASLLLLPLYGYDDAAAPRLRATCARVLADLHAGPGLIYRNVSGRVSPEGAFGICSFWAVEALARGAGTLPQAQALFDQACAYANDVGLMAEEIEPATGEALGNFPQGFTHVGLINAALALQQRAAREAGAQQPAAGELSA